MLNYSRGYRGFKIKDNMKNKRSIAVLLSLTFLSAAGAAPVRAGDDLGGPGSGDDMTIISGPGDPGSKNTSRQLMILDSTSKTLCYDQAKLIKRVGNVQTTLQTSAYALGALSVLEANLVALEASVNTLYTAAQTAEAIPQSREKAKPIRESLGSAKTKITKARAAMTAITLKTEPIRVKLQSAADKAGKIESGLKIANNAPCGTPPVAKALAKCVSGSRKRACASKRVDMSAAYLDQTYREYDDAIQPLLADPVDWIPSVDFVNPFNADMQAIDQLRRDIEALTGRLNQLAGQLGTLNAILDQEFGFSFPYPSPAPTNPFRMANADVKVSGRIILNGADAIQRAIERYLGGFLWGVLRGLGVDQYVRQLQDLCNSALDAAMKAVNFNIDIDLPSMDILESFKADELVLEASLDALKLPEVNLNTPGLGLPGIPTVNLYDSLKGLNPDGLQIPFGFCKMVEIGCK